MNDLGSSRASDARARSGEPCEPAAGRVGTERAARGAGSLGHVTMAIGVDRVTLDFGDHGGISLAARLSLLGH